MTTTIPAGYSPVSWTDVHDGQQIWLAGTRDGEPYAYGPFTVLNRVARFLANRRRSFMHYGDDLLVETPPSATPDAPDQCGVIAG